MAAPQYYVGPPIQPPHVYQYPLAARGNGQQFWMEESAQWPYAQGRGPANMPGVLQRNTFAVQQPPVFGGNGQHNSAFARGKNSEPDSQFANVSFPRTRLCPAPTVDERPAWSAAVTQHRARPRPRTRCSMQST
jgi:hypothetical protein